MNQLFDKEMFNSLAAATIKVFAAKCAKEGFKCHISVNPIHAGNNAVLKKASEGGALILNIDPLATRNLFISEDGVVFDARAPGQDVHFNIPIEDIGSVFAKGLEGELLPNLQVIKVKEGVCLLGSLNTGDKVEEDTVPKKPTLTLVK